MARSNNTRRKLEMLEPGETLMPRKPVRDVVQAADQFLDREAHDLHSLITSVDARRGPIEEIAIIKEYLIRAYRRGRVG